MGIKRTRHENPAPVKGTRLPGTVPNPRPDKGTRLPDMDSGFDLEQIRIEHGYNPSDLQSVQNASATRLPSMPPDTGYPRKGQSGGTSSEHQVTPNQPTVVTPQKDGGSRMPRPLSIGKVKPWKWLAGIALIIFFVFIVWMINGTDKTPIELRQGSSSSSKSEQKDETSHILAESNLLDKDSSSNTSSANILTDAPSPGKTSSKTSKSIAKHVTYKVRKGDTLYGIAKKHGISIQKLIKLNNLRSNLIHRGQVLRVK